MYRGKWKNNISNMMSTPVFTASDFNDTPVENANTSSFDSVLISISLYNM